MRKILGIFDAFYYSVSVFYVFSIYIYSGVEYIW